jgi:hypothetical protein
MQEIDKVLEAAAGCKNLELMMQGLQVASKLIACNGGWLEQHRDITWAALWKSLASMDRHHYAPQPMQASTVASGECASPFNRCCVCDG